MSDEKEHWHRWIYEEGIVESHPCSGILCLLCCMEEVYNRSPEKYPGLPRPEKRDSE